MLKLYTNIEVLTETYRRQVFPLLFDLVFVQNETLLSKYKLVDAIEDADIVVVPIDYAAFLKHSVALSDLLKKAKQHKKTIWIYSAGDYGFTNYIQNTYTFRLGGFDSQLDERTLILPSFISDPYGRYLSQGFSILKKEVKPSIGFVGHAQSGLKKYLKEYINHSKYKLKRGVGKVLADKQPFYPSSIKRAKYLESLVKNEDLNTQFVLRNQYRAGAHSTLTKEETTEQFYDNIFNNGYTFCSRGVGNFSVRFYETLAVGRIPVLINTDCRLPLQDQIQWESHCLIIDVKSKLSMAEQILKFHNNLDEKAFESLQQSNRDLWLNSLTREAYFVSTYNQFKTELK